MTMSATRQAPPFERRLLPAQPAFSGGGSEGAVEAPFEDLADLLVHELDDQVEGAIGGR